MVRLAGPAALALLLVLAGCSGLGGEPTPTLTPLAVPEDEPTPTARPAVAADDRVNPLAVSTRHAAVLRRTPFAVERRLILRAPNGSVRGERRLHRRVGRNGTRVAERVTVRGTATSREDPTRIDRWYDGARLLVAITANNTTTYRARRVPAHARQATGVYVADQPAQDLYIRLAALQPRVRNRTGEPPRIRIASSRLEQPDAFARHVDGSNPRNVSFEAVIEPDGLVRERHLRYVVTRAGRPVHVERHVVYTRRATGEIERPSWTDAAIAATRSE